jgi:glucose-1-phosphate thymidylyltransferase
VKGVVLAGGLGTRMLPLTRITNKHLLPVYDKPMIFYPIEKLAEAGIRQVMLVTGGNSAGEFLRLLKNGKEFGLKELRYAYQEGEGGIAEALGLAADFVDDDAVCVILGDNIFEDSLRGGLQRFAQQERGARIFLKRVPDPQRFGVPTLRGDRITAITEKPRRPASRYAVTGIYMYDARVFGIIPGLKPSRRGELEITDVNNAYVREGMMRFEILKGWWTDAGTIETLHRASNLIAGARGR